MIGLDILNKIKPAKYKYRKGDGNLPCSHLAGKFYYGMIAQDIAKDFPHGDYSFLIVDPNSGYYKVAYDQFIPVLIKGVQEMSTRLEELEKEVKILKDDTGGSCFGNTPC